MKVYRKEESISDKIFELMHDFESKTNTKPTGIEMTDDEYRSYCAETGFVPTVGTKGIGIYIYGMKVKIIEEMHVDLTPKPVAYEDMIVEHCKKRNTESDKTI